MDKIIVTGAAGMLGTAVIDLLGNYYQVVATDLSYGYSPEKVEWKCIDLTDLTRLKKFISQEAPDVVVHCAALVNVDICEKDHKAAELIHVKTTEVIAEELDACNRKLIYISTDSVFSGEKENAYEESDTVAPPNAYAYTKLNGEYAALAIQNGIVLRTNIFGWSRADKTSFAEWVLKGLCSHEHLNMFTDVKYTPINVFHLADIINHVIIAGQNGLFHAGGRTVLSKFEFGNVVAKTFGLPNNNIKPVSVDSVGLAAKRPKNMALDSSKLEKALKIKLPEVSYGVALLKDLYDNGWLARVKGRPLSKGYKFWEI